MNKTAALLLTSALCLSGCVEFRGMPSLDMKLPEVFSEAPPVETTEKPAPLSQDWWKQTEDASLIALLSKVEQQNLSLEQARFRLLAARESARKLDYLPIFGITTETQFNRLIQGDFAINSVGFPGAGSGQQKTTGFYNARLESSWELPLWGQYGIAENVDKAVLTYAEADLAAVRANVIAEAVRIYSEMRGFQQQRALREAILAAHEKIVDYQSIKHKAGLIADNELATPQRNALDARSALQATIKNEVAAKQQLAALMGQAAPDAEWDTPAAVPSIALPELGDTPLDVLRNRPDIRRAEAAVLREAGQLKLTKANLYPRITLGGNLSQLDNITGSPLPGKTIQLTGTPAISIPLFDWGKRLADARAQDAKLSETASAYRETVVNAMTEVESFLSAARATTQNQTQAVESAALEKQNQQQADLLFSRGLTDGIAAETAKITAMQAEINAVQARVEHVSRIAALTKALGGGVPLSTNPTTEQLP